MTSIPQVAPPRPRPSAAACILVVALIAAGCSSGASASWCDDARHVTSLVSDYRGFSEIPDADDMRVRVTRAVEVSERVVEGAEGGSAGAFSSLGVAIIDLDRVLGAYGYDLLRAQSESSTVEQDDLYALDGLPVGDSLAVAMADVESRCTATSGS